MFNADCYVIGKDKLPDDLNSLPKGSKVWVYRATVAQPSESERLKAIYDNIKQDAVGEFRIVRESYHGYYTESFPVDMKFVKRGDKFYLEVDLHTFPSEHERERKRFSEWLNSLCGNYGWTPHLTSGGVGKYTYRLNGEAALNAYL